MPSGKRNGFTRCKHLAVCAEVRTLLGLRVRQAGFVYEIDSQSIIGRVVQGRRSSDGWEAMKGVKGE